MLLPFSSAAHTEPSLEFGMPADERMAVVGCSRALVIFSLKAESRKNGPKHMINVPFRGDMGDHLKHGDTIGAYCHNLRG
jgi:hypothetical protein